MKVKDQKCGSCPGTQTLWMNSGMEFTFVFQKSTEQATPANDLYYR